MKFMYLLMTVLVVVGVSQVAWAQAPSQQWRVQMGNRTFAPRCDEIGDLVIGGEDGKTPIYSCRVGEHWQAVKGDQVYTPRCSGMRYIWWSPENREVMYTCTSDAVFAGSQAQPNSPWKFRYVKEDGSLCSPSYSFPYPCNEKLVNEDHVRGYDYIDVRPRRFPEGVIEISFQWAPPAPVIPENADSDVEVVRSGVGHRVEHDRTPLMLARRADEYHRRSFRNIPNGMPSADPTGIPGGKPAVVSCGNEVVTHYLTAGGKPVWIKHEDTKQLVCVDTTLGKAWDDTWDLVGHQSGTASYFALAGGNWRLVNGRTEGPAYGIIRWHEWVDVSGADKRVYIATGKAGESTAAVYGMLDSQQLFRSTKPIKMLCFIPAAGTFVFAIQG